MANNKRKCIAKSPYYIWCDHRCGSPIGGRCPLRDKYRDLRHRKKDVMTGIKSGKNTKSELSGGDY